MSGEKKVRNFYSAVRVRRWTVICQILLVFASFVSGVLTYKGLILSGVSTVSALLLTLLVGAAACVAWTLAIGQLPTATRRRRALFGGLLALVFAGVFPLSTYYAAIYTSAPRAQKVSMQRQTDVFGREVDRLITARRDEVQLQHYMEGKANYFADLAENERKYGALSGIRGKSQLYSGLLQLSSAYSSAAALLEENSSLVETTYLAAISTNKRLTVSQLDFGTSGDEETGAMKVLFGRLLLRANEHLRVLNHSEVPTALLMLQEAEDGLRLLPVVSRRKRQLPQLEAAKKSAVAQLDSSRARLSQLMEDMDNAKRTLPLLRYHNDIEAIETEWSSVWSFAIGAAVPDFLVPAIALFCLGFVRTQRRRPMKPKSRPALGLLQGKEEGDGKNRTEQTAPRANDPFRQHYAG